MVKVTVSRYTKSEDNLTVYEYPQAKTFRLDRQTDSSGCSCSPVLLILGKENQWVAAYNSWEAVEVV